MSSEPFVRDFSYANIPAEMANDLATKCVSAITADVDALSDRASRCSIVASSFNDSFGFE